MAPWSLSSVEVAPSPQTRRGWISILRSASNASPPSGAAAVAIGPTGQSQTKTLINAGLSHQAAGLDPLRTPRSRSGVQAPHSGRFPFCAVACEDVGWGGRIRTSAWWNQNPLPYRLATPHRDSLARMSSRRSLIRLSRRRKPATPLNFQLQDKFGQIHACGAKTASLYSGAFGNIGA